MKYYSTKKQLQLLGVMTLYFAIICAVGTVVGSIKHYPLNGFLIGLMLAAVFILPFIVYYTVTLISFLAFIPHAVVKTGDIKNVKNNPVWKNKTGLSLSENGVTYHTQCVINFSESSNMIGAHVRYVRKKNVIFILQVLPPSMEFSS